jgi:hypothetical protein
VDGDRWQCTGCARNGSWRLRYAVVVMLGTCAFVAGPLFAQQATTGALSEDNNKKEWSFSLAASGYIVPNDRSYASPIFTADRQRLHLETRYNDEDKETASLWVGYNLSAGSKLVFEATPMLGGVFGNTSGVAPGGRLSLTYKRVRLSSEVEYVFDIVDSHKSFLYSWNELVYSATDWFHAGLVSQRTRAYHTSLDVQRGVSVGFSHKKVDFTTYVFNAGWTDPTIVLVLGFNF